MVEVITFEREKQRTIWCCQIFGGFRVGGIPYMPILINFDVEVPRWYRWKTKILLGAKWERLK